MTLGATSRPRRPGLGWPRAVLGYRYYRIGRAVFDRHKMTHTGTAKVLSCDFNQHAPRATSLHGWMMLNFTLILDLRPDGGSPFWTEVEHRFEQMHFPNRDDALTVTCNPAKKFVELDLSEDARFKHETQQPCG